MQNVLSALEHHAASCGDRAAISVLREGSWTTLTYGDLRRDVDRWAELFQARGYAAGGVVLIVLRHRHELYAAFVGAMRAGLVPSFLPYPTPKQDAATYWETHKVLLDLVAPVCILSYGAPAALFREAVAGRCEVLDIDAPPDPVAGVTLPPLAVIEAATRTALLQHSSGTTGLKKGVALSFGQIRRQFEAYAPDVMLSASSTVISWLPLYHDMGLISSFLLPVTLGARIVSIDAFDWLARPDMLLTLAADYRATHCWLPNFAFNHLARTRNRKRVYDLSSFRALVSCSEPAKPETMRRFMEAFAEHGLAPESLRVCYAMAETVFAVTQTASDARMGELCLDAALFTRERRTVDTATDDAGALRILSCGAPITGMEVRIAASPGEDIGEIQLRSPFLASGYFRNPAATAEAWDNGWYRTGDLGFLRDAELYVCGRIKELLIVHGRNFYATDIEEIVSHVSGVKPGRAVAFGLYDSASASEEVIVLAESEADTAEVREAVGKAIRAAVFSGLELTVRTVEIVPIGHIIKTTSGKVSRAANRDRYQVARTEVR